MHIGIIGLGLIGGSIAKGLKKVHPQNSYLIGYDLESSYTQQAYDEGVINAIATDLTASFSNCSVIFLCTPVSKMKNLVETLLPHIPKDCILTDIGSTKYEVIESISLLLKQSNKHVYFIGGHPMTGSEKSGYFASSAHLFENAYYILTPTNETPPFIIFILNKLIERLGAIPMTLSPSYHDFATASVSHLPHVIASSLVHLVKKCDGENKYLHTLAAGGFKDITRIASSNPDVWSAICTSNKSQIMKVYQKYLAILQDFYTALENNDEGALYNFFEEARSYRNTFSDSGSGTLAKKYGLYVDVQDEPGIIAAIATLLSTHHINIKNIGVLNNREFENGVIYIDFDKKGPMLEGAQILSNHGYTIYY